MRVLGKSVLLALMFFLLSDGISYGGSRADDHYNKGVRYASEGSFIKAREEFKAALKIAAGKNSYRESLKESLRVIEDAIALKVRSEAVKHVFKGAAYVNKGMWEKVISELTKAIEIDPRLAVAYNNRGVVYKQKGQYDRAIYDYTKAIEIDPQYAVAYTNRGIAYKNKGQYDRAISEYTKAIEIDPKLAAAYYNRGLAYKKKGQYDRAVSEYTRAIEIDPEDVASYTNRGFVYLVKLGKKTKACMDFRKACELGECRNYNPLKSRGVCR